MPETQWQEQKVTEMEDDPGVASNLSEYHRTDLESASPSIEKGEPEKCCPALAVDIHSNNPR